MRPVPSHFLRFSSHRLLLIGLSAGLLAAALGCATGARPHTHPAAAPSAEVAGVWDGTFSQTVTEGQAAGDTREERQERQLDQRGRNVSGYYLATLPFTSGDVSGGCVWQFYCYVASGD